MSDQNIGYLQANMLDTIISSGHSKLNDDDKTFGCSLALKVKNGDLDGTKLTALFEE